MGFELDRQRAGDPAREPGRRYPAHAAVGPDLVVVLPPGGRCAPGLMQGLEPLLVQALVPELAVEALDVAVLHGPARLDQDVAYTMAVGPGRKGPTGELRAVVGAHGQRVAAEGGRAIQQPRHVLARDAPVHCDVHALVAEVIDHRETFDAPASTETVADEIHAPDLIDASGQLERHALRRRPSDLPAPAHGKVGFAVQPVHAFVVQPGKLRAQHVVNAPVAKSSARVGNLDDLAGQFALAFVRLALYPENALERVHVKVRLGQQLLELGVLALQLTQPLGIGDIHSAESAGHS